MKLEMHRKLIFILVGFVSILASASTSDVLVGVDNAASSQSAASAPAVSLPEKTDKNILNHLDVGFNLGTTGLGINLSMPVTDWVKVRAGVDYIPRFSTPIMFDIVTYQQPPAGVEDASQWMDEQFGKIADIMYKTTGIEIGRKFEMRGNGRLFDFKFLVDVYPLRNNRRWHVTAGFYLGSSRVAYAENHASGMPPLLAMKLYNNIYDYVMRTNFLDEPVYKDIYLDPDMADELKARFSEVGRLGVHAGDFADGSKCFLEPGSDGMVKASLTVNRFKPYLGFGYNAPLTRDGRWNFGFDAGVLCWGQPKLITHEQPLVDENQLTVTETMPDGSKVTLTHHYDLVNDLSKSYGKVGRYIGICSFLKVYPVINFKISFNIF